MVSPEFPEFRRRFWIGSSVCWGGSCDRASAAPSPNVRRDKYGVPGIPANAAPSQSSGRNKYGVPGIPREFDGYNCASGFYFNYPYTFGRLIQKSSQRVYKDPFSLFVKDCKRYRKSQRDQPRRNRLIGGGFPFEHPGPLFIESQGLLPPVLAIGSLMAVGAKADQIGRIM